jgi:hypothetical protein
VMIAGTSIAIENERMSCVWMVFKAWDIIQFDRIFFLLDEV